MDEEIKKLIDDYVKQIEAKEADLTLLKNKIDEIVYNARTEMNSVSENLDLKFESNEISEEEYLNLLRKEKATILQKTEEKLNSLVGEIEKTSTERQESEKADAEKLKKLKEELGISSAN